MRPLLWSVQFCFQVSSQLTERCVHNQETGVSGKLGGRRSLAKARQGRICPTRHVRGDERGRSRLQDGQSIENALRRFKRKVQTEDMIKEVKRHSFYLKPGRKASSETSSSTKTRPKEDSQRAGIKTCRSRLGSLPECDVRLDGSCEKNDTRMDLGKTRAQYFGFDSNDGFVAVDVLLRQEPDDEEDDEEDEDRSHDEAEDDDHGNDDGYSE
jgi:small subunit ribosomal protein S21